MAATVEPVPVPKPEVAEAVAKVIDSARPADPAPAPARAARGRPSAGDDVSRFSQNPEAVRARRRRQEAKERAGQNVPESTRRDPRPKFTPALVVDRPAASEPTGPSSEELRDRATGFFTKLIQAIGHVAAKVFNDDRMKVPAPDAEETAAAIIDGWPELAVFDEDGKKWMAVIVVGSLVAERYGYFQRSRPPGRPVMVVDSPAGASAS